MEYEAIDREPRMITHMVANDKAEMSLSVPEDVIEALQPNDKLETLAAVSRVLDALSGGDKATFADDFLTVTSIEGMEITLLLGSDAPLRIQEFCGGIMLQGSAKDVARYQRSNARPLF